MTISDANTQNPSTAEEDQQCPDQPTPHLDSQSSKTPNLDDQDPQNLPHQDSANPHQDPQDSLMADPEPEAPSAPSPRNADATVVVAVAGRRGQKRKKLGARRTAQERKSREKFQVLVETLKPIPFVPAKVLDFTRHQILLQRLGLWDFVHIEFDCSIRSDLLAQLIASYIPNSRCSYVNGVRINVNRADLGRALKLPVKKTAVVEDIMELLDSAESIAFIEELAWNWMLLHDDTFIMPPEVLTCTNLIKEGHLEKVDWAGLIWNMLEKELKAPQLVDCYYASHLQHLIKTQHEELLREAPKQEAEVKGEEEEEMEVEAKDEEEEEEEEEEGEEVEGNGDVKMGGVDDGQAQTHELEEHNIELSLGQDNIEKFEVEKEQVGREQLLDFEQSKEEEPGLWLLDQKNSVEGPFLRQCHTSDMKALDCGQKIDEGGEEEEEEDADEDDVEEDEHDGGFHLSPKCIPMEGMSSGTGGLIQAMEAAQMPFSSGIDLRDNSVGDFLSSRDDHQMISGASLFGNGHKRDIALDNHNSHHSLNDSNKRLRTESPWNAKPVDFEMCMEQIDQWVAKVRMIYASKEQTCEESTMNQQLLLNEVQKRDNMIEHLHKSKLDDNQRKQMEIYRLEKELYMMTNLLEGYRKALKETQKAFAEYRVCCPQADEPLYKEVPGSGGLVLSVMELEKERLKQQEEERVKRLMLEKKLRDFEGGWISKLEVQMSRVKSLGNRLLALEAQIKLLNDLNAKLKVSNPPESAPSEGEAAAAAPSEGETAAAAPSEGETAAAAPSEGETAAPSEGETAAPSEGETAE